MQVKFNKMLLLVRLCGHLGLGHKFAGHGQRHVYRGQNPGGRGHNHAKAMQAGVSIINAWVKDMQAHFIPRLELQKIISASAGAFIHILMLSKNMSKSLETIRINGYKV
jgi:hypothetical protein